MKYNITDSAVYDSLETQLIQLIATVGQMKELFRRLGPASIPQSLYKNVIRLAENLPEFHSKVKNLEEQRKVFRGLSEVGQVVNSSLESDEVLQIVMDTIIRLTEAERGFLMLKNSKGELEIRIARDWEQGSLESAEFEISKTVINRVADQGNPVLTTNAQEDTRFTGQDSIIAFNLRSILCVPLKVKDVITGVVYVDNRIRSGLFTQDELELLSVFGNQAAVAIENARLFNSVRKTLSEVTELKNLMDNVFSSIPSGVVTTDEFNHITLVNRSAERILGKVAETIIDTPLKEGLESIYPLIKPYYESVLQTDQAIIDMEGSPVLPEIGRLDLRFSLSPLKDSFKQTQGVAVVMEDLTERKRLEAQKRLFERMVSPAVIDQIDPHSISLGGQRSQITALFADIRGFTSFSESVNPEELVMVLNQYLSAAAEAILNENGTIDKFLGDAVMAWFNAPVLQEDHPMRAIRAAISIRNSLDSLHRRVPAHLRLSFGIGIHVGDAIMGLVGSERRLDFTAIGDSVNTAKRIQENAGPGQILISQQVYEFVHENVVTAKPDQIQAKGKREPLLVYEVLQEKSE
ncbi:MAG: GAF domain-containing protein [Anaerolineaceae bacterium]|nr:GAF domain-containing protein [Anaerolineaceae bacterium]